MSKGEEEHDLRATPAIGSEDLDTVEGGLLGNTVSTAADSASAVSAMALVISGSGADEVGDLRSTALELLFPFVSLTTSEPSPLRMTTGSPM